MMTIWCPREHTRVLLWPSRIRSLQHTPLGIELVVECWCGEHVEMLTGRDGDAPHDRLPATAVI